LIAMPTIKKARDPVPTEIGREEVRRLVEGGAQLVEVLPEEAYKQEHLPGAVNIPLKELNRETTARLQPDRPVIVYCYDTL
jgi:phage shock protein E